MKLKYNFETMEMDDQVVAIPVGDDAGTDFRGIVKLNESGAVIFDLLREETTVEEVVEALAKDYDTPKEEIRRHVREFVDYLAGQGVLAGV